MSMKRYVTVLEVTDNGVRRLLGGDCVCAVDGRLSNRTALIRSADWVERYAKFHRLKRYIAVLFRTPRLSGGWTYVAHRAVAGDATIPAIQSALD